MSADQQSRDSRQRFLKDLDKGRAKRDRLLQAARRVSPSRRINRRSAADKLRANLDAAVYSRAERDSLTLAARRVSAEALINHGVSSLSVYGQESNPTTWLLAAMNMAIRGLGFYFGKEPANSFTSDQHPDLRADYVMANPPFNISEWWDAKLEGDPRWKYGTPPKGNANFAWIQHMLHHLAPHGSMEVDSAHLRCAPVLLANGSMSSGSRGEGDICGAYQSFVLDLEATKRAKPQ